MYNYIHICVRHYVTTLIDPCHIVVKKRLSSSSSSFFCTMLYCFTNRLVPATGAFMPTMHTYFFDWSELTSRIHVHKYIYTQDTYPHTQYWFQYKKRPQPFSNVFFFYYYYFQNCAKVYNSYINGLARDLLLLFVFLVFTQLLVVMSLWWIAN